MPKTNQQVIEEIKTHIRKRGGEYRDWYVGVGTKGHEALFSRHRVREKGDRWICRKASTPQAACEIRDHFVRELSADGEGGPGAKAARMVYAYRKASHTQP